MSSELQAEVRTDLELSVYTPSDGSTQAVQEAVRAVQPVLLLPGNAAVQLPTGAATAADAGSSRTWEILPPVMQGGAALGGSSSGSSIGAASGSDSGSSKQAALVLLAVGVVVGCVGLLGCAVASVMLVRERKRHRYLLQQHQEQQIVLVKGTGSSNSSGSSILVEGMAPALQLAPDTMVGAGDICMCIYMCILLQYTCGGAAYVCGCGVVAHICGYAVWSDNSMWCL